MDLGGGAEGGGQDEGEATAKVLAELLEAGEQATGSRIGSALRLAEQVGVPFEQLIIYAWRRHLAAAVTRVEALGANDEDLHTVEQHLGSAPTRIPHRNKSPHGSYRDYYSDAARDRVAEVYAADLEAFGYTF